MRAGRLRRPARLSLPAICLGVLLAAALPAAAVAQSSVQAALAETRISDRDVRAFYRARNHRPLWVRGNRLGPEADALLALIETARLDGLDPDDYRPRQLAEAIYEARGGSPRALAEAEALLSRRFAAYVRDVRRPRDVGMIYTDEGLAATRPDERVVLETAAAAPSLLSYVQEIGWMHPFYGRLRNALAATPAGDRGRQIAIPSGPILREGDGGERVRLLRMRLGFAPDGGFDEELADALRAVQAASGLPADARLGPRTLAVLNGSGGPDRQRLLRINLERAAALPSHRAGRYILVDAAAARLWMYEDGRPRDSMRVVVGRVTNQTPMMAGLIRYVSVNPYWNIPPDLVSSRVAQGVLRSGVGFLRTRGFEVLSDWSNEARILDPATIDWRAVAAGRQTLRVRQLPGPENAMGRMKFMFPNDLGVYLHDTPERDLLREASRQFSAGCVRVEDAARLARWLFGRPLNVPRGGPPEQHVDLPEAVPVYITYLTAAPEGERIAFRPDVYGRDIPGGSRRRASR